jgi:hypothetical protein
MLLNWVWGIVKNSMANEVVKRSHRLGGTLGLSLSSTPPIHQPPQAEYRKEGLGLIRG